MEREGFARHGLGEEGAEVWERALPPELVCEGEAFEALWAMHPKEFHEVTIHGRTVPTPRWQQAYGANYHYAGSRNDALPIAPQIAPLLAWCRREIDPRLNGLLLNWYDGARGHYIGAHRDDRRDLIEGSPIVTISFGEERIFRMRPWKGRGFTDLVATPGHALVIPWQTNLSWTHELPRRVAYQGRRISVTIRAFVDEAVVHPLG